MKLIPKPGHHATEIMWGQATVEVEFWWEEDGSAVIDGMVINGVLVPACEYSVDLCCQWSAQIEDAEKHRAADAAESLAFDAYREKAEHMGWAA